MARKMNPATKLALGLLPLLGIVIGYAWAHLSFTGRLETWHLLGKPGQEIARILGIRAGEKLLVETETGQFFSLPFSTNQDVAVPPQFRWQQEQSGEVDKLVNVEYYGADFTPRKPPFQVAQLLDYQYLYHVEGKGQFQVALDQNGDLWMWNHQIAGMTGLVYYFLPFFGFIIGSLVSLMIIVIHWLKGKPRLQQPAAQPPAG